MDSAQIESLSRTTVDVAYHCGQLAKNLLALECCRMKAVSRRTRLVYMCISTPPLSLSLLVYALSLSLSLSLYMSSLFPLSVCLCCMWCIYDYKKERDYTSNGVFFRLNDLMKTIDVIEKR